jgi:SHS2 domain-containing protein
MRRYRTIEHTADIGLTAYGASLPQAFENAAYGLFSIIADLRGVKKTESRTIELAEESPEALLYEWLNTLIFLFDTETIIFKRCAINEFDGKHLKAVCYGEKYDPLRHHLKSGVKAATYHMLKVDREKNQVSVIFDV